MPTSYTQSDRLPKMLTGENRDIWGEIINGAFDRIDEMKDGVLSFALDGGTKTLIASNDDTDEAHFAVLNVTGGGGGTVIVPSVPKHYYVRVAPAVTGPVILTAGSATATVLAGEIASVICTGTDVFRPTRMSGLSFPTADTDVATKAYVDNIASVAGNLPGQTGSGGKFLKTNGASASWVTIGISDVAGLASFQTNLTASNSQAISDGLAAVNASNASFQTGINSQITAVTNTANAASAAVAGIVNNTALTGATTAVNLTVSGNATLPSTTRFAAQNTDKEGGQFILAAAPNEAVAGDMYVDRYNGNFRVFTGNGARILSADFSAINGTAAIWHSQNFNPANYQPVGSYQAALGYTPVNKAGDTVGPMTFAGTTAQMGNGVGGGYYADATNLAIRGLNATGSTIYFQSYQGSVNYGTISASGANFSGPLTQAGQQVWHTGNFNPANYLALSGGTVTGQLYSNMPSTYSVGDATNGFRSNLIVNQTNGSSGDAFIDFLVSNRFGGRFGMDAAGEFRCGGWSYGATSYKFWTERNFNPASYQPALGFTAARQGGGPSQGGNRVNIGWDGSRMRMAVDGSDLGQIATLGDVGTKLGNALDTWATDSGGNQRFYFESAGGGSATYAKIVNGSNFKWQNTDGTTVARIDSSGNVVGNGAGYFGSDARWKTNVRTLSDGECLDLVLALEGKRYLKHGVEEVGFIAQEVEALEPTLVTRRDEGELEDARFLNYANLTAFMPGAFRALLARVAALEARA